MGSASSLLAVSICVHVYVYVHVYVHVYVYVYVRMCLRMYATRSINRTRVSKKRYCFLTHSTKHMGSASSLLAVSICVHVYVYVHVYVHVYVYVYVRMCLRMYATRSINRTRVSSKRYCFLTQSLLPHPPEIQC